MKLVKVKWLDSCNPAGAMWQDKDRAQRLEPSCITSVGFIAKKTKRHVTLVQSFDCDNDGNLLCIPRCSILKLKRLS